MYSGIYINIYINLYIRCRLKVPRACGHVLFYTVTKYQNQLFEEKNGPDKDGQMPLFH